jgi:hypothetical protein
VKDESVAIRDESLAIEVEKLHHHPSHLWPSDILLFRFEIELCYKQRLHSAC